DSSGANAPSTNTSRRLSISASNAPASFARALAAASGGIASGFASRISARKSVYFHSSMRRCGSPTAENRSNAAARIGAAPGSLPFAACHSAASCCSAAFFIRVSSAIFLFRRDGGFLELRVAARLQLVRQLLAAGLHDAALREHVHDVRHDVIEQALIVRDDDEAALRRTQPVD